MLNQPTVLVPKPKFSGTIAIDSLGEWARLTFAKDMGHDPWDVEDLRAVNNFSGMGERIAIILRRLKNIRDQHNVNIVVTAHEGIDKIYAKGGMIAKKGESSNEPIGVWGRPDIPGQSATQEILRAFDNIFRVRMSGTNLIWCAQKEALGGGGNTWEVKDRFNACQIQNGYLPISYSEIERLALGGVSATVKEGVNWNPPYMWLIYGPPGFKKTLSLKTFPKPLHLFDLDGGSSVLKPEIDKGEVIVHRFDPDNHNDYDKFISELFSICASSSEVQTVRKALGLK